MATSTISTSTKGSHIIEVKDVRKHFLIGGQEVEILKGITVDFITGDFIVVLGPSGCGKSTLLHIILGLEVPNSGRVTFLGENIYDNTNEDYRSSFRKKHIGMVYQQANWIKSLDVKENVAFPLILLGMERETALQKAVEMLKTVEMDHRADFKPTELSSGQQQRVALARALINNPEIIIADEPTGNLDFKSGEEMMLLLANLNKNDKKTIVMVTHDLEYIKYANTAIRMLDGEIVGVYDENTKSQLSSEIKFKRGVLSDIDAKKVTAKTSSETTEAPEKVIENVENGEEKQKDQSTVPQKSIRVISKPNTTPS